MKYSLHFVGWEKSSHCRCVSFSSLIFALSFVCVLMQMHRISVIMNILYSSLFVQAIFNWLFEMRFFRNDSLEVSEIECKQYTKRLTFIRSKSRALYSIKQIAKYETRKQKSILPAVCSTKIKYHHDLSGCYMRRCVENHLIQCSMTKIWKFISAIYLFTFH